MAVRIIERPSRLPASKTRGPSFSSGLGVVGVLSIHRVSGDHAEALQAMMMSVTFDFGEMYQQACLGERGNTRITRGSLAVVDCHTAFVCSCEMVGDLRHLD